MSDFGFVLLALLFPALGNISGGLLAEFIPLSRKHESLALHTAVGVVLAVVAVEIMPRSLAAETPWIPLAAFFLGSLFFIFMDYLVDIVQVRFGDKGAKSSWLIFFGVCVDLLSDGLMIGAGSIISLQLGLVLAIAQTFADVPEGFASISAFKRHGVTRKWRLILTALFLVPLLMGAVIGYFGLRGQAPIWQYSMLAFTGGILFIMTIEEMIPEAHQEEHPRLAALFLSGGFVLFTLVSMVLGE